MSSQSDPRLDQVQRLIESEQFEAARALLIGILRENPRDTRALFLYALAAANREEAVKVLNRVLELDPLNQNAKSALARIEGRSVEASPPPPPTPAPSGQAEPLRQSTASASAPRQRSSGGYDSSIILAMVGVVVIIAAAIAVLVVLGSSEEDEPVAALPTITNTPLPSNTPTITNTPDLDALATFEAASNATLPPSWTPAPTATEQATRTPGPTFGVEASDTPLPTFTATQPAVVQFPIDLQNFSRLFNEYYELSAQATFKQDSQSLTRIAVALDTIIESIRASNYNSVENDPALVSYAEDFMELLNREGDFAEKRAEVIELDNAVAAASSEEERGELNRQLGEATEDLEALQLARLEQLEVVETRLRGLDSDAAATAQANQGQDAPGGPTTTPIVIPTAAEE